MSLSETLNITHAATLAEFNERQLANKAISCSPKPESKTAGKPVKQSRKRANKKMEPVSATAEVDRTEACRISRPMRKKSIKPVNYSELDSDTDISSLSTSSDHTPVKRAKRGKPKNPTISSTETDKSDDTVRDGTKKKKTKKVAAKRDTSEEKMSRLSSPEPPSNSTGKKRVESVTKAKKVSKSLNPRVGVDTVTKQYKKKSSKRSSAQEVVDKELYSDNDSPDSKSYSKVNVTRKSVAFRVPDLGEDLTPLQVNKRSRRRAPSLEPGLNLLSESDDEDATLTPLAVARVLSSGGDDEGE